jgi:signal transduction histidine kinase
MMMIASLQPEFFSEDDVRFTEAVVRWVGMVIHRAELMQVIARSAVEQGRRAVAEELVMVLAHDLRNLIAPISMRLQVIQTRPDHERAKDRRDADAALKTVDRLTRMISDLLDVARIDQGLFRIEAQPVRLAELATDVARMLSTVQHPIHLEAAEEVVVAADPERLRQTLENLFGNAIQHSPGDAPINVVVSGQQRADGAWGVLDVRDEGPGIPPERLPRIFERFVAGERSHGLGLGLYLARRVAVAHGGDLTVESPPGQGAHFTLSLPGYPPTEPDGDARL